MAAQKRSHEGEVEVDVEDGPSPSKAPRMALEYVIPRTSFVSCVFLCSSIYWLRRMCGILNVL